MPSRGDDRKSRPWLFSRKAFPPWRPAPAMPVLKRRELDFLKEYELCRLATASKDAKPHVVPVIYTLDGEDVIIAVDYKTKKLKNLRENRRVALVVDTYRPNRGLMLEGDCEIVERGGST